MPWQAASRLPAVTLKPEHHGRLTAIVTHCKMPSLYRLCHHLVYSYLLLPPMIKEENREQLHRRRVGMSMSTAPRDLAAIKHAF
jgi:hypothetical protein